VRTVHSSLAMIFDPRSVQNSTFRPPNRKYYYCRHWGFCSLAIYLWARTDDLPQRRYSCLPIQITCFVVSCVRWMPLLANEVAKYIVESCVNHTYCACVSFSGTAGWRDELISHFTSKSLPFIQCTSIYAWVGGRFKMDETSAVLLGVKRTET
jgi:hypothetical protein